MPRTSLLHALGHHPRPTAAPGTPGGPGALSRLGTPGTPPNPDSVLTIRGEFDVLNADHLRRRIEAHAAHYPHGTVDLTCAAFYDQAAVDALAAAVAQRRRAGSRLILVNAPADLTSRTTRDRRTRTRTRPRLAPSKVVRTKSTITV